VNIAFAFGSLPWLPDQMAPHFGSDGTPTRLEPPAFTAVIMSVIAVFIGTTFLGVSWLMTVAPSDSFNLPNRDYWLNKENRPKTIRRICSVVEFMGTAAMLFMLFVQWELFRANQTVPPKLEGVYVLFGICVFLIFVTIGTTRLYLSFRNTKDTTEPL